ncbi:MAG TPA: ferritin-like domain-containing protein [Steroidobacteraceae bacterium]|nr:ferritin-like domain-containing protein [Steroidobacteraceae bacterium]
MEDPTHLGHNRTGMQMSPLHGELLSQAAREIAPDTDGAAGMQPEATLLAETRREYINEAEALGSIPPPATLKGAAKSGAGMLTGQRLQVFIDKVAERMAYERGGARLYDAAIVKAVALAAGTPVSVERMKQIRNQEVEHANLLWQTLEMLGADPTAQTPCADLVGVQSMGLLQAASDPRTSLAQTLSSLLAAELIDVASWELLARLARAMHHEDVAERFDRALEQENQHLADISSWYEALLISDAKLLS